MPNTGSKPPKTHHFIPQFQLEYFELSSGKIQQYDCKENKYSETSKGKLAAENHLYTWTEEGGKKNPLIEVMFSKLEGQIAGVFKKIDSGDFHLNNEERSLISFFVAMQMFRTPQNRERTKMTVEKMTKKVMKAPAFDPKVFASHIKEAGKKYPDLNNLPESDVEDMRKMFLNEDYDLKVPNEYFLHFMIEGMKDIAQHIHENGWVYLLAPSGSQFITSDDPYVMVKPKKPSDPFWLGPGIKVPGTEITLPLTPKICLLMSPSLVGVHSKKINQKTVRMINLRTASNSRRFIYGGNEVLLRSLVKRLALNDRGVRMPTVRVDGF